MKLLIYVPTIVINGGRGDCIHVRELTENLSKLGNSVTVICRLSGDAYNSLATIKRVRSCNIDVVGWVLAAIYGLFLGLVTARGGEYDLIYTRAGLSTSACLISRLAKVPCVTEVNGLIRDETKISQAAWWRKALGYILDWIEGKGYRRSQHLVAVTASIKRALIASFGLQPEKITVIPNGANTDLFKPLNTTDARRELNLNQSGDYICFIGNLARWQGIENLIRSVPYIVKECPDTRFLIVGDGVMKEELVKLAEQIGVSDKAIFTGMIPYEKVPFYINASDICAVPKKPMRGGYSPLKLCEYMACEKPVVATRTSGFELLEENNAGLLVNLENSREFANAIIKLLQNPELRKQLGENGRKYVVENRSWESVARRVAQVCEQVLQGYRTI